MFNHVAHENGWFDNVKSGESSPGNSGEVLFQNLTDTQLEDYRIIPEDAQNYKPLVKPENDVVYQVDGVYMKDFNNDRYWYKIGNGLRLTISGALGAGPINFVLTTTSYWGHLSKLANRYGYKNKSEDHWYRPYEFSSNGNPFDQFKFPFKL